MTQKERSIIQADARAIYRLESSISESICEDILFYKWYSGLVWC